MSPNLQAEPPGHSILLRNLSYSGGEDKEVPWDCLVRSGPVAFLNCYFNSQIRKSIAFYIKTAEKKKRRKENEKAGKSMLGPASYITVENGSKMKQKLNISKPQRQK